MTFSLTSFMIGALVASIGWVVFGVITVARYLLEVHNGIARRADEMREDLDVVRRFFDDGEEPTALVSALKTLEELPTQAEAE